jgi:hypothetical protein
MPSEAPTAKRRCLPLPLVNRGASVLQRVGGGVCRYGRTWPPSLCSTATPCYGRPAQSPRVRPYCSGWAAGFAGTDAPGRPAYAVQLHPATVGRPKTRGCVRTAAGGRRSLQVRTHLAAWPMQYSYTLLRSAGSKPGGASVLQRVGGGVCRYGRTWPPGLCSTATPCYGRPAWWGGVRPYCSGWAAEFAGTDAPGRPAYAVQLHPAAVGRHGGEGCVRTAAGGRRSLQVRTHLVARPMQYNSTLQRPMSQGTARRRSVDPSAPPPRPPVHPATRPSIRPAGGTATSLQPEGLRPPPYTQPGRLAVLICSRKQSEILTLLE